LPDSALYEEGLFFRQRNKNTTNEERGATDRRDDGVLVSMMAGQVILDVYNIYMGGHDVVPRNVTRVRVHESIRVIPEGAFYKYPNLVEFECHNGVDRIEKDAFYRCPSLKRVIIPGVTVVDRAAFLGCESLTDVVDCDKLERIGEGAFRLCKSLRCVKMPSIEIVEGFVFDQCENLTDVTFGNKLERFGRRAFSNCLNLRRITVPLKDGMITHGNDVLGAFQGCRALKCVNLVGGIHKKIAALQLEDWRKDMNDSVKWNTTKQSIVLY